MACDETNPGDHYANKRVLDATIQTMDLSRLSSRRKVSQSQGDQKMRNIENSESITISSNNKRGNKTKQSESEFKEKQSTLA